MICGGCYRRSSPRGSSGTLELERIYQLVDATGTLDDSDWVDPDPKSGVYRAFDPRWKRTVRTALKKRTPDDGVHRVGRPTYCLSTR
jgi:hypothetical protein